MGPEAAPVEMQGATGVIRGSLFVEAGKEYGVCCYNVVTGPLWVGSPAFLVNRVASCTSSPMLGLSIPCERMSSCTEHPMMSH